MSSTSRQLTRYANHQVHKDNNTQRHSSRETLDEYIPDAFFQKIALLAAISLSVKYPIEMLKISTMLDVKYYQFRVNAFDAFNTKKLIRDRKQFRKFQWFGAHRIFYVEKRFIDTRARMMPKLHELKPLFRNVQSIALTELCFNKAAIEEIIKTNIGAQYPIKALDRTIMNCLKYYQFEVDAKDRANIVIFFAKFCDQSDDDIGSDDDLSEDKVGNYTYRHFMDGDKYVFAIKKSYIDLIAQSQARSLFLDKFNVFIRQASSKSGCMNISSVVDEKSTVVPL